MSNIGRTVKSWYRHRVVTTTETPLAPPTRGHKKKARTRQLLLDTALVLVGERGEGFSVAELANRAGVSHGTFYNYFADREQLVAALAPYVVERFAERMALEVTVADPAERFARISARALEAGLHEPELIRVALRIGAVHHRLLVDGPLAWLRHDLGDGHTTGRFRGAPDDATLDVVVGALTTAVLRVAEGETAPAYRRSVLRRLLQALGVSAEEATQLAADAVADLP
jgi:AcrR family transcriptional regulator